MRSTVWIRLRRAGLLLALLTAAGGTSAAAARPDRPGRGRAINLFASAGLLLEVNRVQCGITDIGEVCAAFAGSPVGGGGFWPKGTPDQYIFNTGLMLAGLVSRTSGFTWAGDSVGAYIFDPRGTQTHGTGLTLVHNALNPSDIAPGTWPNGAIVRDAAIYNPVLLGRPTISQGDAWVRYWEGDPVRLSGRTHPMGIAIDERAVAWNFPSGNEDIVYFIFTFYNVTARDAAVYNNPTIDPALRTEIAALGAQFQNLNEAKFNVPIPDGGYAIDSMYAAFGADMDVADFSTNYATAILPFNLGLTYAGDWLPEVGWQFPPAIFGPPFASAPGFVGVKYLRSPESSPGVQVGLSLFTNLVNAATGFPDPLGVRQLYRYLSGFIGVGDNNCTFIPPSVARQRRLCFLSTSQADARFIQSSGPFTLPPGESRTIVVAYVHAAPLAALLGPFIGQDPGLQPGIPATGDTIFARPAAVRTIDRVAGWVSQSDANGNQVIEQSEVVTAPRSLLDKALVAQTVFDNGFLLPFSPEAPQFHLVPGNNQVTVVWQESATETVRPGGGDPYFSIASQFLNPDNTRNPLYDPNFRQYDVEGYRIYRGRTSSELTLIAQFDYAGTTITDYTGAFDYGTGCAPELGINNTVDSVPPGTCPVAFDTLPPNTADSVQHSILGNVIQVPPGGRVELASGDVFIITADTALTGTASGRFPALEDTGVPFAFVDAGVRNSFTYHYAVTALDVNSLKSGPASLESPRVTRTVTPRKPAANLAPAVVVSGVFGDDTTTLNPRRVWTINATTGRFTGPPPPTGAGQVAAAFAPLVSQLLPQLDLVMTVDSARTRTDEDFPCGALANIQGICFEFFVTYTDGVTTSSFRTPLYWPILEASPFNEASPGGGGLGAFPVQADSASAARFGIPDGFSEFNASVSSTLTPYVRYSAHENQGGRRLLGSVSPGGSRWFSGADETEDHPGYSLRVGRVPGVDSIYAPLSHLDIDATVGGVQNYTPDFTDGGGNTVRTNMQCAPYAVAAFGRQADIEVTWGPSGTIASVRDVTHRLNVPFKPVPQSSYGFITNANGNGMIDWRDFDRLEGVAQSNAHLGFCAGSDPGAGSRALLVAQPAIGPVTTQGTNAAGTLAGFTSTGTGFGMYINGQQFIFQLTGGNPPAAGTKWTLRSYSGMVNATTNPGTTTPSGYTYTPQAGTPAIAGLRVTFKVSQATEGAPETADVLDRVHTVPDPYYVTTSLETTANSKLVKFVNLPAQAIIRIYSVSGVLVNVLVHDDAGLGGEATWNLRNRNNQFVASGVYFYHVETPVGNTKVGRFTIVNFAP